MRCLPSLFLVVVLAGTYSVRAEESWTKVSVGKYVGYCEQFTVDGYKFIVEGCTGFGEECEFKVTREGVELGGEFFRWDLPGFQASKTIGDRHLRINFMEKFGNVVVADLNVEQPKGKLSRINRMSVSLAEGKMESAGEK